MRKNSFSKKDNKLYKQNRPRLSEIFRLIISALKNPVDNVNRVFLIACDLV